MTAILLGMKTTLLLLASMTATVPAYPQTHDASCYEVRALEKTVCEFADGTASVVDHPGTMYVHKTYTAEEWAKLKPLIFQEEARILAEREAERQAALAEIEKHQAAAALESKALAIRKKKDCLKAGFVWNDPGVCEVAK